MILWTLGCSVLCVGFAAHQARSPVRQIARGQERGRETPLRPDLVSTPRFRATSVGVKTPSTLRVLAWVCDNCYLYVREGTCRGAGLTTKNERRGVRKSRLDRAAR
jgi:hypothetical protein